MEKEKKEAQSSMEIVNFAAVNLPGYTETINKEKKIVEWGDSNMWPKYLLSLLSKSARHGSIVNTKARLIGGQGFNRIGLNTDTMLFLKNYRNEFNMDQILYKCAVDLEIFGGFALNLIWSKDRSKISEINYINISKIRVQNPKTGDDKEEIIDTPEQYWFSDGWENTRKYPPILYPGFSTINKKKASQILFVKEYEPDVEWYPQPVYKAGIRAMETDYLIDDFHMNNIRKAFMPNMQIVWPIGTATEEEKDLLVARMKSQFEGTQGEKTLFFFPKDAASSPTITPIELNDTDARFLMLDEQIEKKILASHQINDPSLVGVETPGKLGNKTERSDSLEDFQNKYVTPKQNLLESIFNRIRKINGITDNLIIKKYSDEYRKVDSNIQDTISVLTSGLTPEQQYWVFIHTGLTHEVSSKLTGYKDGNNPDAKPTPTTPIESPKKQPQPNGQPA